MKLLLKPQEIPTSHPESNCTFTARIVATRTALAEFDALTIIKCISKLRAAARRHNGIDRLQVFQTANEEFRLWFIDDGDHVTALLPSDY